MSRILGGPALLLLAEYGLKSSIILGLGLAAASLARRRSASLRHFVLSLALLSLLILPLLSFAPFGWETRILPRRTAVPERVARADAAPPGVSGPAASAAPVGAASLTEVAQAEAGAGEKGEWGRILLAVWAAGAALVLLRLVVGLLGARRLTRESETVADPIWKIVFEKFLAVFGMRRDVRLKSHREVVIPLTWGLLRPVILIPAEHGSWTDDQRSSVLYHELSHIKRADFLVMCLVRLSFAAFWFNPLSWIAVSRIRREQEKACDDLVLRAGVKPSAYAANLLRFRRGAGLRWGPSAALLGLFGGSSFNERLSAILRQRLAFKEVTMKAKIMLTAAIVLAAAIIGCARPAAAPVQTAPPAAVAAPPSAAAEPAQEAKAAPEAKKPEKAAEQKIESKKPEEKKATVIKLSEGGTVRIEVQGGEVRIIPESGDPEKVLVLSPEKIVELRKAGEETAKIRDEIRKKILVDVEGRQAGTDELRKKIEAEIGDRDNLRVEIRKKIEEGIGAEAKVRDEIRKKLAVELDTQKLKAMTEKIVVTPRARALAVIKDTDAVREQAKKIRETLTEVKEKKRDLADLEKEIEKLEAELEKKPAGEFRIVRPGVAWSITKPDVRTEVRTRVRPGAVTVIRDGEGEAGTLVSKMLRERVEGAAGEGAITVKTIEEGGGATVVAVGGKGKTRADYERVVARLKKDLPEGLTLEPEFDEASGVITLTVKGAGKTGIPEDLIKKIAAALKDEKMD